MINNLFNWREKKSHAFYNRYLFIELIKSCKSSIALDLVIDDLAIANSLILHKLYLILGGKFSRAQKKITEKNDVF